MEDQKSIMEFIIIDDAYDSIPIYWYTNKEFLVNVFLMIEKKITGLIPDILRVHFSNGECCSFVMDISQETMIVTNSVEPDKICYWFFNEFSDEDSEDSENSSDQDSNYGSETDLFSVSI